MEIIDVRNQLARHPSKIYSKRSLDAIKYLVIHHSATREGDAFSFARYHVNHQDWPGIGYHYVILENGTIQWTNDINTTSYHVKGQNTQGLGICLVGDFTTEILEEVQKEALKKLVINLLTKLNLDIGAVVGHNELNKGSTLCPALDMNTLREYIGEERITIYLNNKKLDVSGELKNNITYVSLRSLGEALGYEVEWDADSRSIYLTKDELLEEIQQENNYYLSVINKIKNIIAGV